MARMISLLYTLLVSCICACLASFKPCSTDADCPAITHFCDSKILRKCERCDYDVCKQSLPDWERSCARFCPEYLDQVIHKTPAPSIIVKDEQSKEAEEEAPVGKSPTFIAGIVVVVAGVCLTPAIAVLVIWKKKRRPPVANDAPGEEMQALHGNPNENPTAAPRQVEHIDKGELCLQNGTS